MITTEEAKQIAKIMFDGGPKKSARIGNITKQIALLPDAVRVNFDAVRSYLDTIYNDYNRAQAWNRTLLNMEA